MEENIDKKYIGNRKIIIEIRFDHKVILADKKGELIEKLSKANIFNPCHWEMGSANFNIFNGIKREDSLISLNVEMNRISFISRKIDTVESYYNSFNKLYKIILEDLGTLSVTRIGCRILGTYKTSSLNFNDILEKMKNAMPKKFFLEDYAAIDYRFDLRYKHGMYNIGPINDKHESFMMENFPFEDSVNHVGFGIDTDNFITNEVQPINEPNLIHNVFLTSLSVEKSLFNNLYTL